MTKSVVVTFVQKYIAKFVVCGSLSNLDPCHSLRSFSLIQVLFLQYNRL